MAFVSRRRMVSEELSMNHDDDTGITVFDLSSVSLEYALVLESVGLRTK